MYIYCTGRGKARTKSRICFPAMADSLITSPQPEQAPWSPQHEVSCAPKVSCQSVTSYGEEQLQTDLSLLTV